MRKSFPAAQRIADHLSHKSSIILVPPPHVIGLIESFRKDHDPHFQRWPAHVNLLYPFLKEPSQGPGKEGTNGQKTPGPLKPEIASRIVQAVKDVRPFELKIRRTGIFEHTPKSSTLWLRPECGEREQCFEESGQVGDDQETTKWQSANLARLQQRLQDEFSECDADARAWAPHLSIASSNPIERTQELERAANEMFLEWCQQSHSSDTQRHGKNGEWEIDWRVDSIMVVERFGHKGRFNVVAEISLNGSARQQKKSAMKPTDAQRDEELYAAMDIEPTSRPQAT